MLIYGVGILFLVLFGFFAVVKIPINHWFGYRTPASMRDEKSWRLANRYMGKVSII
ncbi:SdpI family protein [Loigolactobacillus binensis]|uniref:SdpI family protein n=1 Tax=Loigolactobacillus binensis TaxID=2559922 RepID=A0ABW3EAZ0_9LACO|nr:SdpI family protein [Loigolactobacillus binensis]